MNYRKQKLTEEQKAYVVQRLAHWDTPAEAADALKIRYGVDVTPQACEHYDPNKKASRRLARKWEELFIATRAAFQKDLENHVPEANKSVRILQLARAARSFKKRGNYVAMAKMLERIAKERGGSYTNQRQLTGKGGGPIEHRISDMTDEEVELRMAQILAKKSVRDDDRSNSI